MNLQARRLRSREEGVRNVDFPSRGTLYRITMERTWLRYSFIILALWVGPVSAQDDLDDLDDDDDLSLMLDLDDMDTGEVRALADKMLKTPGDYSAEAALRVISHPDLNDSKRAERLYRSFKGKVTAEDYEVLADSPLLREGFSEPIVAGLVIRLVGITKNPEARSILLDAFRRGDPAYRAAAAHAIGLSGDKRLLPVLQKALDAAMKKGDTPKEYLDGLVRGMLHLGDAKHLPRLIAETAAAASTVARAVLKIASGYTPPREKFLTRKRLPGMRQRHRALTYDIVDIAPLFPKELAEQITKTTGPGACDVLYRSLPRLITEEHYGHFIPALRARNWDLRQLALDILMDGKVKDEDLPEVRRIILEWYEGDDAVGRAWAVRNSWALDEETRGRVLMEALDSGARWLQVEAARAIRGKPTKELLASAKALAAETQDPDVLLDLNRLLLAHTTD